MNHVLISGATGVLGSDLVPLFVSQEGTRVTLLLRADSAEHLENRRRELLEYWRLSSDGSGSRVEAVIGDTSQPLLGLSDTDTKALSQSLTHIVHSAGNVKLNQSMDEARRTALGSARSVVELVRRCGDRGPFCKLEFVSTVGVAGRRAGTLPEERIEGPRGAAEFHNTYEAAKWEAETYVWEQIDDGLPATVHRPSMIVGDSTTGRIMRFQVFYFLMDFLLGRRTRGLVPKTEDAILDIIPVDYVAKAIYLASHDLSTVGQVWHLCSGPEHSWKLEKLVDSARQLLAARGERIPKTRRLSPKVFRLLLQIAGPFTPARSRRFLRGLPYLLDYLDERQVFDNTRTSKLLREKRLEVPAVDTYLGPVMNAYWDYTSNRPPTP